MFSKKYKKVVTVDGMKCKHCQNKVIKALKKIENVKKVKINEKEVTIISSMEINNNDITDTIRNLDYRVIGITQ